MSDWAAKVLEGVVRLDTDPNDYSSLIPTKDGSLVSYDNALAAIARMGAGDGWLDVFKNIATEAERVAAYEKTRAEAAEAERDALRERVARLEGAIRALGVREMVAGWNGEGRDKPYTPHPAALGATIKTTCGAVYALDAAISEGGKDG